MVSSPHEALHRIFQKDPALLTRTLQQVLDVPFPEPREFAAMNIDLTEIKPVERRVDTLMRAEADEGTYLLVVESQGKQDDDKRRSWPYYLSYLYAKYHCEPVLIVTTQSSATARWAAEPIHLGVRGRPSLTVRPLVLGPDNVPLVADEAEAARDVALAVFSAITHGKGRNAAAILEPLAAVLKDEDPESAMVFAELVESGLVDTQAKKLWKELMVPVNYFFKNPVAVAMREEVRVEERVAGILRILDRRHIEVPESVRERVSNCTDPDLLQLWWDRAIVATDAAQMFDDDKA
ncbi:hypothetical protein [Streptomyces brasiliscabiei]|uniref:hypothetical protein n=1 Tax=Streptomyces brasiliscabiei TaxID=2736302 RepID=UPI001C1013E0|nr:hypothetical protein [Streptomyces brasiliscabiei]